MCGVWMCESAFNSAEIAMFSDDLVLSAFFGWHRSTMPNFCAFIGIACFNGIDAIKWPVPGECRALRVTISVAKFMKNRYHLTVKQSDGSQIELLNDIPHKTLVDLSSWPIPASIALCVCAFFLRLGSTMFKRGNSTLWLEMKHEKTNQHTLVVCLFAEWKRYKVLHWTHFWWC